MNKLPTAPPQNPNQEYIEAEPARPVYCEDEKIYMDLADCQLVGDFYYSKRFLKTLQLISEGIFQEAERLDELANRFFRDGSYEMSKIKQTIGSIHFEMAGLLDLFRKIDIAPKGKK